MSDEPAISVIRPADVSWHEVAIPGSEPPVRLVRLDVEPSGAFTVLVAFPPGWRRLADGRYDVAEEALFLEGSLQMSGRTYNAGDYGFFPPGCQRVGSTAPKGVTTLAWFGGPQRWSSDPGDKGADPVAHRWEDEPFRPSPLGTGKARLLRDAPPHETWLIDEVPAGGILDRMVSLFALDDRVWARVPAGVPVPALHGPVLCRLGVIGTGTPSQ